MTRKQFLLAFACCLVCCLILTSSVPLFAQSSTSPQGGAGVFNGVACVSTSVNISGSQNFQPCTDSSHNGQWFTVMNAPLKTSTTSDLFISPSMVTGLYTNTQVKGQSGSNAPDSETATAVGSVSVRVLLDCSGCAAPGAAQTVIPTWSMAGFPDQTGNGIVFDARIQQLTATLGQAITSGCSLIASTTLSTCPPETIDLILSTTSAHSFNFIMLNVGSGQHTVTVQARLDTGAVCYAYNGTAGSCSSTSVMNTSLASSVSAALFGVGSVTVLPVHLSPGFNF
jgi:hypothetical protein